MVVGRSINSRAPARMAFDDDLRLFQNADSKNGAIGHVLAQQFYASQCLHGIIRGNVDQGYIGIRGADAPVTGSAVAIGKLAAGLHGPRNTGAIDQHLQ